MGSKVEKTSGVKLDKKNYYCVSAHPSVLPELYGGLKYVISTSQGVEANWALSDEPWKFNGSYDHSVSFVLFNVNPADVQRAEEVLTKICEGLRLKLS